LLELANEYRMAAHTLLGATEQLALGSFTLEKE
jgi:hypothetical protein